MFKIELNPKYLILTKIISFLFMKNVYGRQKYKLFIDFLIIRQGCDDCKFKPNITKHPREFLMFVFKPFNFPIDKTHKFTIKSIRIK